MVLAPFKFDRKCVSRESCPATQNHSSSRYPSSLLDIFNCGKAAYRKTFSVAKLLQIYTLISHNTHLKTSRLTYITVMPGDKLYNTQYLKSWSENANRELYLTDQSVLENSYTMNSYTALQEDSWIDLESDSWHQQQDESVSALLWGVDNDSFLQHDRTDTGVPHRSGRRSSNTTITSITFVGNNCPTNANKFNSREVSSIPEQLSSTDSSIDELMYHKRNKRKSSKRHHELRLTGVLFQISCLSVIIASFSFSLGFIFGTKSAKSTSNLRYFWFGQLSVTAVFQGEAMC